MGDFLKSLEKKFKDANDKLTSMQKESAELEKKISAQQVDVLRAGQEFSLAKEKYFVFVINKQQEKLSEVSKLPSIPEADGESTAENPVAVEDSTQPAAEPVLSPRDDNVNPQ